MEKKTASLWIPGSARSGHTHACRICGTTGVDPRHISKCYRHNEARIRSKREAEALLTRHPEPELEAFMREHGSLNRKPGTTGRPVVITKPLKES